MHVSIRPVHSYFNVLIWPSSFGVGTCSSPLEINHSIYRNNCCLYFPIYELHIHVVTLCFSARTLRRTHDALISMVRGDPGRYCIVRGMAARGLISQRPWTLQCTPGRSIGKDPKLVKPLSTSINRRGGYITRLDASF